MKKTTITIISAILISVFLFIAGIYFYGQFAEWAVPNIEGVKFQVSSIGSPFKDMLEFALVIALIPASAVLTWKLAPIMLMKNKVLNIIILVSCVFLGAFLRQKWVSLQSDIYVKDLVQSYHNKYQILIPVEEFNVTNYMALGLLAGTVISFFALKQKIVNKG